MPGIDGNLALKYEDEETVSRIGDFDDDMESRSKSKAGQYDYLQAKCKRSSFRNDASVMEPSEPFCSFSFNPDRSSGWRYSKDLKSYYPFSSGGSSDTEVEGTYAYTIKYGPPDLASQGHSESNWMTFCTNLFPGYREHTVEEREAYSNFIDSFFEEISI